MAATHRPLTDSPWIWAFAFATFGLVALFVISPKYGQRQAQIEREFQGRQRALEAAQHGTPSVPLSTAGHTLVGLGPLFAILAAIVVAAGFWLWRHQATRISNLHREQP